MQCTFLSSEVAVVFVLQIQSNEWPKHSYIFWFEHVSFKIYPNEIDTGIWSWIIHCPGTINDCGQQHLPVTLQAGSDDVNDHFHVASTAQCWNSGIWAFVRQAYGLLFLSLHSNRSEDSKPWRDQQVAVFLPGNCVSFDVFQVWFKLEGCGSWWHSNLLRSQDRCITEAVRKVTLGATLLLHTGLVCWWGTQSSVGSVDHLKRFCKMLVDWCHPCCFCQRFEVQLVTTRADKLSMQPIRIFCSDGTDLAVTG